MRFDRLLAPFRFGRFTLENRVALLPYGTAMVQDGHVRADDIAHYENIARSRPGLMFTGATVVHPSSAMRNRILVEAWDESIVDNLKPKVDALHAHGVTLFGQILHLGREWTVSDSDYPPMAPSALRSPRDAYLPREMDHGDIATVVKAFGRSALNLKRAGYDGIDIHGAHGYLVAQFLSPATNHRSDAYGGTAEKRLRFLLEVIDSIRAHCGEEIGLSVRLSADEEIADGMEVKDTIAVARALETHGGVDLLSITLGTRGMYVKDMTAPDATAANAARAIRGSCGLPVLLGQRISQPEVAERVLAEGAADLVGMARAFLADPAWLDKVRNGEAARIRPCLNFNQDCRAFAPHLHCGVNPVIGRETRAEFRALSPATQRKRIAVIGGGPGGLEAALTAARRGHEVRLFEASEGFGGQFLYASAVPHRQGLKRLIDHQLAELRIEKVRLELGARIENAADIGADVDAAIVATGAQPRALDTELQSAGVLRWFEVLAQGAPAPHGARRALFIDDGSGFWWNYGVAEALVEAGWSLTIATPSGGVAHMIPHESIQPLLARLAPGHTRYRVLTGLAGVNADGAMLLNLATGDEEEFPCELVVVQTGRVPQAGPQEALRAGGIAEVHVIGDCITPRRASFAIFEAQRVARVI